MKNGYGADLDERIYVRGIDTHTLKKIMTPNLFYIKDSGEGLKLFPIKKRYTPEKMKSPMTQASLNDFYELSHEYAEKWEWKLESPAEVKEMEMQPGDFGQEYELYKKGKITIFGNGRFYKKNKEKN